MGDDRERRALARHGPNEVPTAVCFGSGAIEMFRASLPAGVPPEFSPTVFRPEGPLARGSDDHRADLCYGAAPRTFAAGYRASFFSIFLRIASERSRSIALQKLSA